MLVRIKIEREDGVVVDEVFANVRVFTSVDYGPTPIIDHKDKIILHGWEWTPSIRPLKESNNG
jgi:hypothetical protein